MRRFRFLPIALLLPLLLVAGHNTVMSYPPRVVAPAPEALPLDAHLGSCTPGDGARGGWEYLSDLPWRSAMSGWQAIADVVLPERDVSFSRNPLVLAGGIYGKGIGTYPFTEVRFDLNDHYTSFQTQVGLNDDAIPGTTVVFLVYADGSLVFNSGVVATQVNPVPLDLCVAGVRELRLVTAYPGSRAGGLVDAPEGGSGSFANWVDARLFRTSADGATSTSVRERLTGLANARWERAVGELGALRAQASAEREAMAAALGVSGQPTSEWPLKVHAFRDVAGRLVLAHRHLTVTLGLGGADHGKLSVDDRSSGIPLITRASSAIQAGNGTFDLASDTVPASENSFTFQVIDDAVLGSGTEARARLRVRDGPASGVEVEVRVALYDQRPYFTYQVVLPGPPAGGGSMQAADGSHPTRFDYFGTGDPAFVLGDSAQYFADGSYARSGELSDDSLWRNARVDIGKPAFVWGTARHGGLMMTMLDEQRLPAWLVARRDPGRATAVVGISQPLPLPGAPGGPPRGTPVGGARIDGPRLLVEATSTTDLRAALATYRQINDARFPLAKLPDWFRYQWGSWWVYGSGLDEQRLRQQIDLIADYLGDLGPWHIVVDAGWQDIGNGGSGDLKLANPKKFPSGIRALVDYAHERGIKVLLFYSAVYVHDGSGKGEWLGMPALVTSHPDWFIKLTPEGQEPARYLFNYTHPEARQYLFDVLSTYVTEYDADGIKIDGLGDVEGQLIPLSERVHYYPQRWSLTPVMDIYRLAAEALWSKKPDAFIESGWVNPAPAHSFAHTFRFGDETDQINFEYPFPGMMQHFDYGAIQRGLLGQRAHIGTIFGGFNRPVADQWLAAGLALGAQISYGNDLNFLSPEAFAALRPWLVHYQPFAGTTRIGPMDASQRPAWSATTIGDLTFLGVMNHGTTPRSVGVHLADAGVPVSGSDVLIYDVMNNRHSRSQQTLVVEVPAQSLQLFAIRHTPGVVWTSSSYQDQPVSHGLQLSVRGPSDVPGKMQIHWPAKAPAQVLVDGRPLARSTSSSEEGYSYDPSTGVLTLHYKHDRGVPGERHPSRTIDIMR